MRSATPALLAALVVLVGCPALGPAPPSLIEQEDQRRARAEAPPVAPATTGEAAAARAASGYTKRTGLHIDVPYLVRRKLSELPPPVVEDQLGLELRREDLPENERLVVFERAELWTHDGRIYRIRKDLAHPMDIPTALGTSGFPLDLGYPIESTTELRWNSTWNMRRIRLIKSLDDERLYTVIDVSAFLPKEFF